MKTREVKTISMNNKNQSKNEWNPLNFQWMPLVKLNQELNLKTKTMKSLLMLPILILLVCTTSCSNDDDTLFGSGNLTTETRAVDTFTKIDSEGVFEVTVSQGTTQSVEITADDNIIGQVRTSTSNNELRLRLNENYDYRNITVRVNITVNNLNGLTNSGVGDMYIHNIDNNGAFSIDNEGTGNIEIDGVSTGLTIRNQGSGDISGFDFLVNDCTIDIEGSGDVKINCSDNLDVDIEGSGNVYFKGTPTINTNITGSGSVINAN
ncbi:head GIN domain-containing protein [Hanstruepera marina]|uniref:head GIN domain-containing protein n=1 Tax=Hanstruepera marina TaxID=2873265 RepID=UPI001CA698FC|nr:head GIN domain-containing protein [Hanstruepera marina]